MFITIAFSASDLKPNMPECFPCASLQNPISLSALKVGDERLEAQMILYIFIH